MKSTHFNDWAGVLAREYGGRITDVTEEHVRLDRASEQWQKTLGDLPQLTLNNSPSDPDAWRLRLQHVEKRIAQVIISAPVAFSCSLNKKPKAAHRSTNVIRFAFGLTLSLGYPCSRRYTAYHLCEMETTVYLSGGDRLFQTCEFATAANMKSKAVTGGLSRILGLIPSVVTDYLDSATTQTEIDRLRAELTKELRDLDRLYVANQGQFVKLLGQTAGSAKGDDAIELEYFSRMEDVVAKYRIGVRLVPLSLGVVACSAKVSNRGSVIQVELPFLDHPLDSSAAHSDRGIVVKT